MWSITKLGEKHFKEKFSIFRMPQLKMLRINNKRKIQATAKNKTASTIF